MTLDHPTSTLDAMRVYMSDSSAGYVERLIRWYLTADGSGPHIDDVDPFDGEPDARHHLEAAARHLNEEIASDVR